MKINRVRVDAKEHGNIYLVHESMPEQPDGGDIIAYVASREYAEELALLVNAPLDKLAVIVKYMDDLRLGKRVEDEKGLNSLLDHPDVAEWLTKMLKAGRIAPSFIGSRNGGW